MRPASSAESKRYSPLSAALGGFPPAAAALAILLLRAAASSTGSAMPGRLAFPINGEQLVIAETLVYAAALMVLVVAAVAVRRGAKSSGFVWVSVALGSLAVFHLWTHDRPPRVSLPERGVTSVEGVLIDDLRPSSNDHRSVTIRLLRAKDRRGWTSSASGTARVHWRGADELLVSDGSHRLMPQSGDALRLSGPWPQTGHLWVEETDIRLRPHPAMHTRVRRFLRDSIRDRLVRLADTERTLLEALILGDRSSMPSEMSDTFRAAGASHVIALSGMHLGILTALLVHLLPRFLGTTGRALTILVLQLVYVWIAGQIPSLLRALVLSWVAIGCSLRGVRAPSTEILGLSLVMLLLLRPGLAFSLGLQLSIWALLGLMIFAPRLNSLLAWILPPWAATYFGTTLAAMLATTPLSLSVFGSAYPVGVICAGALATLVVLFAWTGIAFLVAAGLPYLGSTIQWLIEAQTPLIMSVARWAAAVPHIQRDAASGTLVALAWSAVIVSVCTSAAIRRGWSRRTRMAGVHDRSQLNF